jgi:NADPH-dependent curcumin reductase CurA
MRRVSWMPWESLALGGLGMPAFTAYVGLLDIGRPGAGHAPLGLNLHADVTAAAES